MHYQHDEISGVRGETHPDPDAQARNQRAPAGNTQTRITLGGGAAGATGGLSAAQAAARVPDMAVRQPNAQTGAAEAGENPYAGQNISRNSPCPCGSGLKYKQCHGRI